MGVTFLSVRPAVEDLVGPGEFDPSDVKSEVKEGKKGRGV